MSKASYDLLRQAYEFNLVKDAGIWVPTKESSTVGPLVEACSSDLSFLRHLRVGGEAFLFLVYDKRLGKNGKRVLKIPRPTNNTIRIERFKRSARALVSLHSPYFPYVVELSEDPLYLLLEWIPGCTLREWVESKKYCFTEGIEYFRKILIGISLLHNQGVLHRDIRPDNIIISGDNVKIIDFGLAKLPGDKTLTRVGSAMGVEGYTSPEQDLNPEDVKNPSSDVYSLGKVLYFILTKRDSEFDTETLYNLGYNTQVINLYQGTCQYESSGRYKDASEFLEEVNAIFPPSIADDSSADLDIPDCLDRLLALCAGDRLKVELLSGISRNELIPYWLIMKGRVAKKCLFSSNKKKTDNQE